MKRDFTQQLKGFRNEPMMAEVVDDKGRSTFDESGNPVTRPITAKSQAVSALLFDGRQESVEQRFKDWRLAQRIEESEGPIEITAKELKRIEDCSIGLRKLLAGALCAFLETDHGETE